MFSPELMMFTLTVKSTGLRAASVMMKHECWCVQLSQSPQRLHLVPRAFLSPHPLLKNSHWNSQDWLLQAWTYWRPIREGNGEDPSFTGKQDSFHSFLFLVSTSLMVDASHMRCWCSLLRLWRHATNTESIAKPPGSPWTCHVRTSQLMEISPCCPSQILFGCANDSLTPANIDI